MNDNERWYVGWRAQVGGVAWAQSFSSRRDAENAARLAAHLGAININVGPWGRPEPFLDGIIPVTEPTDRDRT